MGRKSINLTKKQEEKIINLYNNNVVISKIEKEIGFSDSIIYKVLHKYNIPMNRKDKSNILDFETIKKMYDSGLNYQDIANKMHVSRSCIYDYLKNNNIIDSFSQEKCIDKISIFNQGNNNRKYHFDEHIFDNINTADKAYCIGLFMADGCNLLEHNTFTIELQERDVDILEKIKILFQSDYPLYFRKATENNNLVQNTYKFSVNSKYFCLKLNTLGITPRKSLTLDYPNWMDKNLIPYLIKGYIDGDGWIQNNIIGFMSTDKFCYGIQNYLKSINIESHVYDAKRNYSEHTKIFQISSRLNTIPLAEIMFSSGNLYLNRKYEKYIKYGFLNSIDNSLIV